MIPNPDSSDQTGKPKTQARQGCRAVKRVKFQNLESCTWYKKSRCLSRSHTTCGAAAVSRVIASQAIPRFTEIESIVFELIRRFVPALGEEWSDQFWTEDCQQTDCQERAQTNRYHQIHRLSFSSRENISDVIFVLITHIWWSRIGYGVVKSFTA